MQIRTGEMRTGNGNNYIKKNSNIQLSSFYALIRQFFKRIDVVVLWKSVTETLLCCVSEKERETIQTIRTETEQKHLHVVISLCYKGRTFALLAKTGMEIQLQSLP